MTLVKKKKSDADWSCTIVSSTQIGGLLHFFFTIQLEKGAADLVELMCALEYLNYVSSRSPVHCAMDFKSSQSLPVTDDIMQTRNNFCVLS